MSKAAKTYNVLFLCRRNSARSIIAESILNREAGDRFRAYSAGSEPAGEVPQATLDFLKGLDFPTDGLRSKSWDEFAAGELTLDFVFTVCGEDEQDACPVMPGQPMTANWSVPDPLRVDRSVAERAVAYADAFRMLSNRISVFTQLPIAALDRLALQRRLDDIGADRASAEDSASEGAE